MKTKKESKTKTPQLEVVNDIFMVEKNSRRLVSLKPDIKEAPENMVIPEGIEIIGSDIFVSKNKFQCSNIKSVKFPDSLKKIENNAFFRCTNLTDIQFGNGLECIGKIAFASCRELEEIVLPDSLRVIESQAFMDCSKLKNVVFNEGLQVIEWSAFYICKNLNEFVLPKSLRVVGDEALQYAKKVTIHGELPHNLMRAVSPIVFNEGLEKIAIGAFKNCMMLREVNLPASIRELGKSAFVCIPNNRPYGDLHINMTTIPDNLVKALVYYGSLKTLRCIYVHIDNANGVYDFVLPDSITSIRNGYSKIALDFNMLANTEYIHNTKRLETAFHYAASSRYECVVAYKTYLKTKHKAAKEFLEKEQYRVAAAIIEELDEKDFVDFVKLRCINLEYDSCIMKRLQEKNWNIALAYMLEEGKGKPEDALVI